MEVVIEEGLGRACGRPRQLPATGDGVRAEERLNLDRGQFSIVESGVSISTPFVMEVLNQIFPNLRGLSVAMVAVSPSASTLCSSSPLRKPECLRPDPIRRK